MGNRGARSLRSLIVAVLMLSAGCAEKEFTLSSTDMKSSPGGPVLVNASPPDAGGRSPLYQETGIAMWYGGELQGRQTATGKLFDTNAPFAAHRILPLGTIIRVTNRDNQKTITITVNDRGPFTGSAILGLSWGAARDLGFAGEGTARIVLETTAFSSASNLFTVLAAVFSEEESARILKQRLSQRFRLITILPAETHLGTVYRVFVGAYDTQEKAEAIAGKLKREGLEPLVIRKD